MFTDDETTVERGALLAGAGIELWVRSADAALIATCRQVLADLEAGSGGAPHERTSRICLWDYEPGQDIAPFTEPDQKVFYVVPAAHLAELRASAPEAEGHILLKPVTRVVLRAFLASLAQPSSVQAPSSGEIGALRANRDEMLQHLLHANLRLQEYDQQRTNFIARAVHDFRAPLTALSGFCGLLTGGELGAVSPVQQEVLDRMRRSIDRLSGMASAMFDLSAGPRLARTPDLREGDILDPIRQAVHEIAPLAREKHVHVRAEQLQPPPAPLLFEGQQIEQVLVNLLDNACKFVPKYGLIEVRAYPYFWDRRKLTGTVAPERRRETSQAANAYRVDILDSGPGVAPELLEHIFEEYTSYSGSHDRSGGGLGLAICRLIISRHQGHVWAETTAEGSVFSFVLPLRSTGAGSRSEA